MQVAFDPRAQPAQRVAEGDHRIELLAVSMGAPMLVVEVLLAPCRIEARRLEMSAWVHADPHIAPRRRDRQRADPFEHLRIADSLAVGIEVLVAASASAPGDARGGTVRSAQSWHRPTNSGPRPWPPFDWPARR
jgi:hypothetical protein